MSTKEYQVLIYTESALASIFLPGGAKVSPQRFGAFLNSHAAEGWSVVTMDRESRRTFIFFKREAFVVIMERSGVATQNPPLSATTY